jgi:hypothetical protein
MFALLSYPDGTPIVVAGPCWPFCVGVTLPVILAVTGLVSYFLVVDGNFGLVSAGIILCHVFCVFAFSSLNVLIDYLFSSANLNLLAACRPSHLGSFTFTILLLALC